MEELEFVFFLVFGRGSTQRWGGGGTAVCVLGEFVGLMSARVCLGWAWVRVGEGFGERITFRDEVFGERTTLGRGVW
jgi:hypothetical protein